MYTVITATVTMEGQEKGRPRNRWSDEGAEDVNIMGILKKAGNGLRPSEMEKDFTGSQSAQRKLMADKKKE
jgi:hypothetical protein